MLPINRKRGWEQQLVNWRVSIVIHTARESLEFEDQGNLHKQYEKEGEILIDNAVIYIRIFIVIFYNNRICLFMQNWNIKVMENIKTIGHNPAASSSRTSSFKRVQTQSFRYLGLKTLLLTSLAIRTSHSCGFVCSALVSAVCTSGITMLSLIVCKN